MIVVYPIVWILYYNLFHYSPFIDTLDISIFIFLFLKGMNEKEKEKFIFGQTNFKEGDWKGRS